MTWGKAEQVVSAAISRHRQDVTDGVIGLSLARKITDALRAEGLLDADTAGLDRLLFEAREHVAMWGDVVEARMGRRDPHVDSVRDRLDTFRATQGWNPDGFGS